MSGAGGLRLSGGDETLSGINTYTGGTQVNAGANLIINSGAALGTGTLALVGSATVAATLSTTATTTIDNAITVEGDPIFNVASGTTTTIASPITNGFTPGDLVLRGGGKLLLDAANTYTGPTTVEEGNLEIGDSSHTSAQITSTTTVNDGGTLSGYGTVLGSVTVASGGTLAPGATGEVGTLNIIGNYTQNAGSYLDINVTPTSASKLNVTGTATLLGGTVNATALAGTSNLLSKYTLVSASSGVTGVYSSLVSNFAFLSPTLTYDANDVYLSFISNQADYASVATNTNQYNVATGLDTASSQSNSAAGEAILASLDTMSASQAQAAFNSLSGEGISAQQSANFEATDLVVDTARRQSTYWLMNECQTGASSKKNKAAAQNTLPTTCAGETNKKFRSWIAGVGASSSMDGSSSVGSASVSTRTGGGIMGFDYEVSSHLLIGGMVGGTSSNYNVSARSSTGTDSSGQVGLYSVAKWEKLYVNTIFNYGYFSGDTKRYVTGVGATAEQTGKTSSNAFTGRAEVGYRMDHPLVNLMPFVAMQATSLQMNSFNESNTNNLGLSVAGNTTMSEPGSLGLQLDHSFDINDKWSLYPLLRMAWVHEFQTDRSVNASLQALPTSNWTVNGASAASNAANIGITVQAMSKHGVAVFASGNTETSSSTQSYMGELGVKWLF
jgi:outer membrane autotransporter protein